MMDKLRDQPGTTGLVSALGWYITKHSIGIYTAEPPAKTPQLPTSDGIQAVIDRMPRPEIESEPRGRASIETYTVLHDREGQPSRGIVVGRDENDRRFIANTPQDRALLEGLESTEAIGCRGSVASKGGINLFDPN
jgi:acetyl-CoA C-acetyltransferase